MNNEKYVQSLRALADFYETHPELPITYGAEITTVYVVEDRGARETISRIAREIKPCDKRFNDNHFEIHKEIPNGGGTKIMFFTDRSVVCKRVVKGERTVVETTIPAHTEEIVEWVCDDPALLPNTNDNASTDIE